MPQADYASPDEGQEPANAFPVMPAPTIREGVREELRNTLNSRIFYLVSGIAVGLVISICLSKRKGESIL